MTEMDGILRGPIFNPNPPNVVPKSTYELPASDRELPGDVQQGDVQQWLRVHPLAYVFPDGDRYLRCPTCEEWTAGRGGCDVRQLVNEGQIDEARELHHKREWPMGTGMNGGVKASLLGMKPSYRRVTFVRLEAE